MRMLTNEPIGEDLYDGHAQTVLAQRIVKEINAPTRFVDPEGKTWESTVVMALEGSWGCGKSNVIKMVEKEVGCSVRSDGKRRGEAVFVNYDLWMHRQDLSRKSVLESIVSELVDDSKVLPRDFKDKLFHLTGERTHGYVEKFPLVGWMSVIAMAICAIIRLFKVTDAVINTLLCVAILSFIGSILLNWLYNGVGFWNAVTKSLLIARGTLTDFEFVESKHKEEPSANDFLAFMREAACKLKCGCKHVILVFDNLDRLDDAEIKKFWAATHVLFAEHRTKRPNNVQVVIPYDRDRMRKAFGSPQAGDEYIRKVVDKVFVMPTVMMTDWAAFLQKRILAAFDMTENANVAEVIRVFDWLHRPDDLTPRAMISFVNDMVSVCEGWRCDDGNKMKSSMPLGIIALYVMSWRRYAIQEKLDNVELLIISGSFIPEELPIARRWYLNDLNHSTQMAAVVYQLPESKAAEILTYQRVGASLDGGISLTGICNQPSFHQVFSSVIRHVKQFEIVPQVLATIDAPDAHLYWDEYYDVKKDEIVMAHGNLPIITEGESLMFAHISKWQDYYMRLEQSLRDDKRAMFNENLQIQFAKSVESALKKAGRSLVKSFIRPPVEPEEFVKYLNSAREDLCLLNLQCDLDKLDSWFDQNIGNGCSIEVCSCLSKEQLSRMPRTVAKLTSFSKLSDADKLVQSVGEKVC